MAVARQRRSRHSSRMAAARTRAPSSRTTEASAIPSRGCCTRVERTCTVGRFIAARRANALRAWLAAQLGSGAPETLVQRLLLEWPLQAHARWPVGAEQELISFRGVLRLAADAPPSVPPDEDQREVIDLSQPGQMALPHWGGHWLIDEVEHGGIDLQALRQAELRARRGGEQFQRAPNTPPRSLKKQYQLAALATDQRQGPLLWLQGQLAYVPGLGIDARAIATPGTPQCRLRWVPQADRADETPMQG